MLQYQQNRLLTLFISTHPFGFVAAHIKGREAPVTKKPLLPTDRDEEAFKKYP
jgi:hypothetical protein